MKKFFMIACVAAATTFAACNSSSKDAKPEGNQVETTAPETTAPETTSTEGNVIDEYIKLTEDVWALTEKAQKGDTDAIAKLQELGQKALEMQTELQKELPNMTAEQKAKYEEFAKKAAEKAQEMMKQ